MPQITLTVMLELTDEAYSEMKQRATDISHYLTAVGADQITVPELVAHDTEAALLDWRYGVEATVELPERAVVLGAKRDA